MPNTSGFDAPLPSHQTSAHGDRLCTVLRFIQGFFCVAGSCSKTITKGVVHRGYLRALLSVVLSTSE